MDSQQNIAANPPTCPACGGKSVICHGSILDYVEFAGTKSTVNHGVSSLWECKTCSLAFRYPREDPVKLLQAYENCDVNIWTSGLPNRMDWLLAKKHIERDKNPQKAILDVGCFTGAFLSTLENCKRFGIEPSLKAASHARNIGVDILGSDYRMIENADRLFDWITAFDVIEHVDNPADFILVCLKRLKPSGKLLISTGNYSHWTFKLLKNRHYYCSYPEHVAFASPDFFEYWSGCFGLKILCTEYFTHSPGRIHDKIIDLIKICIYFVSPRFFAMLRKTKLSNKDLKNNPNQQFVPPTWVNSKNHFLTILQSRDFNE
jgi:SAM-dependent methyltransferase